MKNSATYLVIGNGRVAQHFRHYFSLLGLNVSTWHRQQPWDELYQALPLASHILLLISDQAIEPFIEQHLKNSRAIRLHVSGSLLSNHACGAHPLMCFSHTLYRLEQYQAIPFIVDDHAPDFSQLLPGIPNQHVRLPTALKAKYHALCVLSGNFSCLLWQKLFSSFEEEFHFPASIAYPYLQQQMQNLLTDAKTALTGPLVRDDIQTLNKNLAALATDPFAEVYKSFVACYQQLHKEKMIS
ncbi:MAG TPA: DUF2520 domain-containing protein [Gammaproteobacteria bacterium]|nr:MAG: hypothetical protein A3E83_06985 [Gammaproteobacteria bacterium RIFCSPHIGHO2_12_FULL_41_20]HLB43495.1 DUF2520 domain-containing protein [Gammaproteobacteria bacterium]